MVTPTNRVQLAAVLELTRTAAFAKLRKSTKNVPAV